MTSFFKGIHVSREFLADALTQPKRLEFLEVSWDEFVENPPPERGGAVGSWSETVSDPFAHILVVRDDDYSETFAWLNSYFSGLSPITQWCRLLPYSIAKKISDRTKKIDLGDNLPLWVGAILAECSVQAGGAQNLREIPGSAALSTATFAASRAVAIWGGETDYKEIAFRHDRLFSAISRETPRPLPAERLIPLWRVLGNDSFKFSPRERDALQPLISILSHIASTATDTEPAQVVSEIATQARDYFDLPELTECATGPQVTRVKALDRLGDRLMRGPNSPAVEAVLGLGASFVDPGSAISVELLRRYSNSFPVAAIWQGVFAGAIMPFRVLTEQGGLGRLVSKMLTAPHDLEGRPTCDIAFEELDRWITPGRAPRLDVRGNFSRVLSVELVTGVTTSFSVNRSANASTSTPTKADVRNDTERSRSLSPAQMDVELSIKALHQRVSRLEEQASNAQKSLDFSLEKETKNKKTQSKLYAPKKI